MLRDVLMSFSSFLTTLFLLTLTTIYLWFKYREWCFFRKEEDYKLRKAQFRIWLLFFGSFFMSCWLFYFKNITR